METSWKKIVYTSQEKKNFFKGPETLTMLFSLLNILMSFLRNVF